MRRTRKWKSALLAASLLFGSAVAGSAAPTAPQAPAAVASIGTETISAEEMLYVLQSQTGGNELMLGLGLSRMDLGARRELASQMAEALLLSEAARARGFDQDPKVAYTLKWDAAKLLAQAYLERASAKWNLSDSACRTYYDAHRDEFVQAEAVRVRHILCENEAEARAALLEVLRTKDFAAVAKERSKDPGSAPNGGDLEWVERGQTAPEFEAAVFGAAPGSPVGPFKSPFGWHVVLVSERRAARQLSFDEAKGEVRQRLQRNYIKDEISKLAAARPIRLDDGALSELGGIPAPK